jgi:hypothetical protein
MSQKAARKMKKSMYFTHNFGARNDPKLINIQIKLRMEGIGIFWALIEMLYEEGGKLPMDLSQLAFHLHTEEEKIKSVINDFDLFTVNDGFFESKTVNRHLVEMEEKSQKARYSVSKRPDRYTNVTKNATNVTKNATNVTKNATNVTKNATIDREINNTISPPLKGEKYREKTEAEKRTEDWELKKMAGLV